MANFYISDLHIGHENILRFDNRPFADVNEMNNKLIENWNARVCSDDTVYILGDFIWAKESEWPSIVGSLAGNKVLIRGNHDPKQFSAATKRMFQEITDLKEIKDSGKHVVMCHYPIPFFRAGFAPTAFMLYGHVHRTIEYEYIAKLRREVKANATGYGTPNGNFINVGCMMPYMDYTPRTLDEIIEGDARYGISTSRGTVGDDIKVLQELGVEIEVVPSTQKRFSLIGRRFDLPELKTLIDAVESARFIPKKKSAALVEKLGSLASQHNTEKLVRNVDVENRLKADNEKVYYIMEALNDAINASKKVSFQYFTYNVRKEQKLKYDGYTYVFSPYKLIWNGGYYYVIGFSEKHKGIGSFRVDRIARCPKILDDDAVYPPKNFDLNVYLNSMFRMYNGQRKQIELVCSNDVMDAIIDKFGKDVHVLVNDMKSFRAIIETSVGSVFYSWIFGFGGKVVIKSPEDVKDEYSSMVLNAGKSLGLFEYGESENQTV